MTSSSIRTSAIIHRNQSCTDHYLRYNWFSYMYILNSLEGTAFQSALSGLKKYFFLSYPSHEMKIAIPKLRFVQTGKSISMFIQNCTLLTHCEYEIDNRNFQPSCMHMHTYNTAVMQGHCHFCYVHPTFALNEGEALGHAVQSSTISW